MTKDIPLTEQLREQIEAAAHLQYPIETVELKIAEALLEHGYYEGRLDETELTSIIRNVVYTRFSKQRVRGFDITLIHNIASINVQLCEGEVHVNFLVHIHSPIVAFLRFRYVLTDDRRSDIKRITLKKGSLSIRKDTRPFDVKAKAALATIDIEGIAKQELTDLAAILRRTLVAQMRKAGISGDFSEILLSTGDGCLEISLKGDFHLKGS